MRSVAIVFGFHSGLENSSFSLKPSAKCTNIYKHILYSLSIGTWKDTPNSSSQKLYQPASSCLMVLTNKKHELPTGSATHGTIETWTHWTVSKTSLHRFIASSRRFSDVEHVELGSAHHCRLHRLPSFQPSSSCSPHGTPKGSEGLRKGKANVTAERIGKSGAGGRMKGRMLGREGMKKQRWRAENVSNGGL